MKLLLIINCIFSFCFISKLNSQSLSELEKKYFNVKSVFEKESFRLDSLKQVLQSRSKQIESEKQNQYPDEDKIIDLMRNSVTLANQVSKYQDIVDAKESELKNLSKALVSAYSARIDSLMLLKKSSKRNANDYDSEILYYVEKRLSVSPQLNLLSFNPQKILAIDLSKAKSEEEKILLREYLDKAANEVDDLLKTVTKQSDEAELALNLQKKTSKFLAETEFDRDLGPSHFAVQSERSANQTLTEGNSALDPLSERAVSYTLLINQLNIIQKPESITKSNLRQDFQTPNMNLNEYSKLLKEVKQKLADYKSILTSKLLRSR